MIAEDKKSDPTLRAAATSAIEEDKARLEDFEDHKYKTSSCIIL